MSVDCSDLLLGDTSFFCLQRRLPVENRRGVFQRSLKGPFCVAPFVAILMKVIVPMVAYGLDIFASRFSRACCPFKIIARLAAMIFTYDLDGLNLERLRMSVSATTFGPVLAVVPEDHWASSQPTSPSFQADTTGLPPSPRRRGVPKEAWADDTTDLEQESTVAHASPRGLSPGQLQLLNEALAQFCLKPFEPDIELLCQEMSFMWAMFFAPIYPTGILFTLVARVIEVKMNLTKLLFVRRRCFPEGDRLERDLQRGFLRGAVLAATGWSFGLSILTYNNDLWRWGGWWQGLVGVIVFLWLASSAGVALMHADRGWGAVVVGVAIILVLIGCVVTLFDQLRGLKFQ